MGEQAFYCWWSIKFNVKCNNQTSAILNLVYVITHTEDKICGICWSKWARLLTLPKASSPGAQKLHLPWAPFSSLICHPSEAVSSTLVRKLL